MITKKCLHCGRQFTKSKFESKKEWNKKTRLFCSKECRYNSKYLKEKISIANKGKLTGKRKPLSEETKIKISKSNTGKKRTDEQKKRIGDSGKGRPAWNKGKPSPWTSERNKTNYTGLFKKGSSHPNWRGGKSFELYGFDFTEELRTLIRKRDKFTCQVCKKKRICCSSY